jgi:predicted DCC family thiol-disulfide oxidoreductase YuxK
MCSEKARILVLFDAQCPLCARFADALRRLDSRGRVALAALQSPTAERRLAGHAIDPRVIESIVVLADRRVCTRSAAIFRILRELPPPWSWLCELRVIPTRWTDASYDCIARSRRRWFGRAACCTAATRATRDGAASSDPPVPSGARTASREF